MGWVGVGAQRPEPTRPVPLLSFRPPGPMSGHDFTARGKMPERAAFVSGHDLGRAATAAK